MKTITTFLSALFLLVAAPSALAAGSLAEMQAKQYNLNNSATAGPASQLGTEVITGSVKTVKAIYDYSQVGGLVSTVTLRDESGAPVKLPKGALVRDCIIDVVSAIVGGNTISIGTGQAADDLKGSTAVGSITGRVACIPVGTAATAIKLTADRTPTMTIGTSAITGGKINVWIDYVLSN